MMHGSIMDAQKVLIPAENQEGMVDTANHSHGPAPNNKRATLALLITPLIIIALAVLITDANGPYYRGENFDAAYNYLLNSLNLLLFHGPGHTDHPGTTLQEVGAVVILVRWLVTSTFGKWVPLQEATLGSPEDYLHSINAALVLLIAAGIFFAGRTMYRVSGSLLAALTLQTSIFLFRETLLSLSQVGSEIPLVATAFALMIPLIPVLLAKNTVTQRYAIAAGFIFGIGLVSKVICVTWACLAAVFSSWKERAKFALACVVAVFLFTLPIWDRAGIVTRWLFSLLIHKNAYGGGDVGIPSSSTFVSHLKELHQAEPLLVYWVAFYIAVILAVQYGAQPRKNRFAVQVVRLMWAGCAVIFVQVAMASKHFVAPRYILPCLVIVPLLNAFVAFLLSKQILPRRIRIPLAVCGAALFIASVGTTLPRVKQYTVGERDRREGGKVLISKGTECKDCILVGAYGSSAGNAALAFGNAYSKWINGKVLNGLYPNTVFYDIFRREFLSFTNENLEVQVRRWLSEGRGVLLQTEPLSAANKPPGFSLTPMAMSGSEVLYQVEEMEGLPQLAAAPPANATVMRAAEMHSGTAMVDTINFGTIGLPVIRTRTLAVPTTAEYWIPLPAAGRYELRGRCASETSRPVSVSVNGRKLTEMFCGLPTGGYGPSNQQWQSSGVYEFPKGSVSLILNSAMPFPHISEIAIIPAGAADKNQ
jgi:hypothetical protein